MASNFNHTVFPAVERREKVQLRTSMKRSAIYAAIAKGSFPPAIKIGERSVAWLSSEIDQWLAARISGADENACKQLVEQLVLQRKALYMGWSVREHDTDTRAKHSTSLGKLGRRHPLTTAMEV